MLPGVERGRAALARRIRRAGNSAADLAGLALELAAWGAIDAATLFWLDPPPAATLASARDLLRRLDALDENGPGHGRMAARWHVCRCIRAWRTC